MLTQTIENRKILVVNEACKDRALVNEIRSQFKMTEKLCNLMMIPLGENQGKYGGAMLLILINNFRMDNGKIRFDKFETSTIPACSKTFQLSLMNSLEMVAFQKRL